jgi:hypothetical protein
MRVAARMPLDGQVELAQTVTSQRVSTLGMAAAAAAASVSKHVHRGEEPGTRDTGLFLMSSAILDNPQRIGS